MRRLCISLYGSILVFVFSGFVVEEKEKVYTDPVVEEKVYTPAPVVEEKIYTPAPTVEEKVIVEHPYHHHHHYHEVEVEVK